MEVRIISKEIIKPSSPTPHHRKTHKLNLKDQSHFNVYFPLLLFYDSGVDKRDTKISENLKRSLSETLTHYCPFAGRVKDDFSVDCDDSGAIFVEAHVAIQMYEVLQTPEIDILERLLPFNPNQKVSADVNLAVQLNYFDCGGLGICVCFSHVVADATAAAHFVKNWSEVACGCSDIEDVIFDSTSLFPPHELTRSIFSKLAERCPPIEFVIKKFVFDGNKIAALREEIKSIGSSFRPTRFEAVAALIWAAMIPIVRENNESVLEAVIPVNLRKRMNPPLPQEVIGNIFHSQMTNYMDQEIDLDSLARNIHETIKMVNDDYVRKVYADGAYVNELKQITEDIATSKARLFGLSGWGGLPFYQTDFGWGKPRWVTTAMRINDLALQIETPDGKGIEVLVSLPHKDMAKFQQDVGILTYASFNPAL
ncbi:Transferase [Melia azedarach]|uniref:Transferase n=1 Tax=Melia azedarach TaxID=155640 RepID=A0ACC1XV37_MELAZ|nr:Transferase [Melia azedarach]